MAQTKYHYNEKTGKVGVCKATEKRGCPLPGDAPHFETKEGGQQFAERLHENKYGATNVVKKENDRTAQNENFATVFTKGQNAMSKVVEANEKLREKQLAENEESLYAPYKPKGNTPDAQANDFSRKVFDISEAIGKKGNTAYDIYDRSKARQFYAEQDELEKIAGKLNTIQAAELFKNKQTLNEYSDFLAARAGDDRFASNLIDKNNVDEVKDKDAFIGRSEASQNISTMLRTDEAKETSNFNKVDFSGNVEEVAQSYSQVFKQKAKDEQKFATAPFDGSERKSGYAESYNEISEALNDVISKDHYKEFSEDLELEYNENLKLSRENYFLGNDDNGIYYGERADAYKQTLYTVDKPMQKIVEDQN